MKQGSRRFNLGFTTRFANVSDGFLVLFVLSLASLRASIFVFLYPDTSSLFGIAWIEIIIWFLLVCVIILKLVRDNQLFSYWLVLRRNILIVIFVCFATISVLWSIDRSVTSFRAAELFLATIVALYLGMRFHPQQLVEFLFWFGAILLIVSIAVVFAAPGTGTMYWPPFNGAWRGIYWHRNHFSSIAALLSVVFLSRTITSFEKKDTRVILYGIFYVFSVVVLVYTQSATGYILFIVLNFLVVCIQLWLQIRDRLRSLHYYMIFLVFVTALGLILSNLDTVFGMFNRSPSMTGRIPLWNFLLDNKVSEHPWVGYGFGAVWAQDAFREDVRLMVGWPSQPLIADNGFLDILLHLGVTGLILLMGIIAVTMIRSVQSAVTERTLAGFFPLLLMIYVLIANIPFSLLAETEVFIWVLMVAVSAMTTSSSMPVYENV